jgi:hypothetical protein
MTVGSIAVTESAKKSPLQAVCGGADKHSVNLE